MLLADRSGFARRLLVEILDEEFELVDEVDNGVEVVEVYEARRPDLVVMGVEMPIRDGVEATEALKERDPEARVVLYTGRDEGSEVRRSFEAGADGCLVMPFQRDAVIAEVEDVLAT